MATAGQSRRVDLAQSELLSDATDLGLPACARLDDKLIAGRSVFSGACRIELDLAARVASPAGKAGNLGSRSLMFDVECLVPEADHASGAVAGRTLPSHPTSP